MKIESSDLVLYNANSRGSSVGDCTARAISLAFNIDYSKARKALNNSARENWKHDWSYNSVNNVKQVIQALGGSVATTLPTKTTVNDWVDSHPSGTYILHCNKNGIEHGPGSHLVCVIDGKVYDSWDSRKCYVLSYHTIRNGITQSDITDVGAYLKEWVYQRSADDYRRYAEDVFNDIIDKNRKLKKLANEYNVDFDVSLEVTKVALSNYTFKFGFKIYLDIAKYDIGRWFEGKFAVVFKPTMSKEEVDTYFTDTFYGKLYSFIQNHVVHTAEDICQSFKLLEHPSRTLPPDQKDWKYDPWDTYSEKSFKSLPYWVQRLTKNFKRQNPFNQAYYSDAIELTIYTPPFDTKYGEATENSYSKGTRSFHAYNMNDLIQGLNHYKKTGDYDAAYLIAGDY